MSMAHIDSESDEDSDCEDINEEGTISEVQYMLPLLKSFS